MAYRKPDEMALEAIWRGVARAVDIANESIVGLHRRMEMVSDVQGRRRERVYNARVERLRDPPSQIEGTP